MAENDINIEDELLRDEQMEELDFQYLPDNNKYQVWSFINVPTVHSGEVQATQVIALHFSLCLFVTRDGQVWAMSPLTMMTSMMTSLMKMTMRTTCPTECGWQKKMLKDQHSNRGLSAGISNFLTKTKMF